MLCLLNDPTSLMPHAATLSDRSAATDNNSSASLDLLSRVGNYVKRKHNMACQVSSMNMVVTEVLYCSSSTPVRDSILLLHYDCSLRSIGSLPPQQFGRHCAIIVLQLYQVPGTSCHRQETKFCAMPHQCEKCAQAMLTYRKDSMKGLIALSNHLLNGIL